MLRQQESDRYLNLQIYFVNAETSESRADRTTYLNQTGRELIFNSFGTETGRLEVVFQLRYLQRRNIIHGQTLHVSRVQDWPKCKKWDFALIKYRSETCVQSVQSAATANNTTTTTTTTS